MRGGPGIYETMDTEGGLGNTAGQGQVVPNSDIVLSEIDCSISPNTELAKLAVQASQQP